MSPCRNLGELLAWFLSQKADFPLDKFLVISWLLWSQHNRNWLNEKFLEPQAFIISRMELLKHFITAKATLDLLSHSLAQSWSPTSLPFFKLNVVVRACTILKGCGLGFILCDFLGNCLIAYMDKLPLKCGMEAQLMTFTCALKVCLDQGIT